VKNFFLSYKNPLAVVLVLIIAGGLFTYSRLQTSLFPEITFPKIKIIADAGLQPVNKMMVTVTKPLENAIKQVPDLQTIRSTTSRGSCEISAFMDWKADIDLSQQRIESKIAQIRNQLPPDLQITVEKMNPSILPVMGYTLESHALSPIELKMLANYTIKPFLSQVAGVSEVRVIGGKTKEYWLQLDADSTVTGRVIPALMRWQRDKEVVSPADFIPAAEDSGLIVPMTEWALAEACRQLNEWHRAGLRRVPVSVNISGHHLQRGNVMAPVKAALLTHQIPARLLELEITETAMMRNLDLVLPQLQALKELGVALSIDDFGTGYSSLAYLKRLPIDILKIDRSFVGELETSRDSAALVAAILAMGHGLRLSVVAEGVETQAQMRRLADQGCRLMQGYLFSRPISSDEFAGLLARDTQGDWCANVDLRGAPPLQGLGARP